MTDTQFRHLLDKFSKGECSPEEEALILHMYEKIGGSGEIELNGEMKDIMEKELWASVRPRQKSRRFSYYIGAVAASFSLALLTGVYFFSSTDFLRHSPPVTKAIDPPEAEYTDTSYTNTSQTSTTLVLSDGTEVMMKPKSTLIYPRQFAANVRKVSLQGEAFFKVTHDASKPFLVYSNKIVTRVLGTSFHVKACREDVTVEVVTGKVLVSQVDKAATKSLKRKQKHELMLVPNQKAVYVDDRRELSLALVDRPRIVLPEPTLLAMIYDGITAGKLFNLLSENYGVHIRYDKEKLSSCVLTTSMEEEGLYERIEIICKAIGATYEVREAEIHVYSEGCD